MPPRHLQKQVLQSLSLRTLSLRATPAVLIMLAVTLMIFHRADTVAVERFRAALIDTVAPVLTAASAPVSSFVDSLSGVATIHSLKAENIRLKSENERLQQWYEAAMKMQAENQSLHELLNVKADPALTFVTARVISDAGGTFVKSVLLPVGLRDKVQKDTAVMSGHGLIGRVMEVGQSASRVLLITDLNSRIPVLIQNTRTNAILAGKNQNLMRLERLPPDSGISVGSRVVTSGAGGQLPPNLPVGVVVIVDAEGVWVKPLSDMDRLSHVQVVNTEIDSGLVTGEITPSPKPAIHKNKK